LVRVEQVILIIWILREELECEFGDWVTVSTSKPVSGQGPTSVMAFNVQALEINRCNRTGTKDTFRKVIEPLQLIAGADSGPAQTITITSWSLPCTRLLANKSAARGRH
jgi:hypothetical protein